MHEQKRKCSRFWTKEVLSPRDVLVAIELRKVIEDAGQVDDRGVRLEEHCSFKRVVLDVESRAGVRLVLLIS